jgi:DNA-binding PadR family transcriptional regulator
MEAAPLREEKGSGAMRSPINWALLGLLIQRPSYGYELAQRFERNYGDTLELSSRSQIYTALDSLKRRDLIERTQDGPIYDPVRQPKLQYRPTVAGLRAYEQWLIEQVSQDERRSRLIAQHFAALPPEHALQVLERCAEACLEDAGRPPEDDEEEELGGRAALAGRLAGEERRLRTGAVLSWIEYARSELRGAAPETQP